MSNNNKKKFDVTTAKKIISDYADKIRFYMNENSQLNIQVNDLKETLQINKELLFKYISSTINHTEQQNVITDLKNEIARLNKLNENVFHEKCVLDRKLQRVHGELEDQSQKIKEELEKTKENLFILQNRFNEKETVLFNLKRENLNASNNSSILGKKEIKETTYTDPTKANVDLNNELNYTREILAKVSKILNSNKTKSEKLEEENKMLKEEIENFKKNGIKIENPQNEKNIDNLSNEIEENITSDEEDGILSDHQLDSSSIKFPDKVKMDSSVNSSILNKKSLIPKLDLTKVNNKYASESIKKPPVPITKASESEKIKSELTAEKKLTEELKEKCNKYKNAYIEMKSKCKALNENLKALNAKLELMETQFKKCGLTPSTDELSYKNNMNTSMVIFIIYFKAI